MDVDGSQSQSQGEQTNDGDASSQATVAPKERTALEHVEDIASQLKTAFPLLALSVELVCDQIASRFKAVPDEDIFRLISALLQDGLQVRTEETFMARWEVTNFFTLARTGSNTSFERPTRMTPACSRSQLSSTSIASQAICPSIFRYACSLLVADTPC